MSPIFSTANVCNGVWLSTSGWRQSYMRMRSLRENVLHLAVASCVLASSHPCLLLPRPQLKAARLLQTADVVIYDDLGSQVRS